MPDNEKNQKINTAFNSIVDTSAVGEKKALQWFKMLVSTMQYDIDTKDENFSSTRRFARF